MGLLRFVFSKTFIINIAIAGVVGGICVVALFFGLDRYTQHGITVTVPDFTGVSLDEIEAFTDTTNIEFLVVDSLYSEKIPRGTVADQEPSAGAEVKCGRKIYLTVNALQPKQVVVPEVRNLSFRQAKAVLESVGLSLGNLEFVPDIAKNAVLDQKVAGHSVEKGETVFDGTVIDLVLGDGLSNTKVAIPYLLYCRLDEAIDRIKASSLNLGTFKVDTPVTDTGLVRVYRQIPAFNDKDLLAMGSSVILYLTEDTSSIEYDATYYTTVQFPLDTLQPDKQLNEDDFKEGDK